ncbi:Murein DD-endopeptidase MepM [Methylophilaceae bacterium]|nr:Murein DD-endopeptidase MepM [Methylophilaceae bacterium]
MAKARTLSTLQIILILLVVSALSIALTLAVILPQDGRNHPVNSLLPSQLQFSLHQPQRHLDALALQLGEMRARVMRLDALSARLARKAGIKEKDIEDIQPPGAGGPLVNPQPVTELRLKADIAELATQIEIKSDRLNMLEAMFLQQTMQQSMLPDTSPVNVGYNSSSFGWRVDPFSGNSAFHEGLDFTASTGTPIFAAAGGVVTTAEHMIDYGKIVKINHGSGLETRYAHASEILVRVGEVVKKGQLIARVGSTGRSTGPHLHFEVRRDGAPLDPRKFLQN